MTTIMAATITIYVNRTVIRIIAMPMTLTGTKTMIMTMVVTKTVIITAQNTVILPDFRV